MYITDLQTLSTPYSLTRLENYAIILAIMEVRPQLSLKEIFKTAKRVTTIVLLTTLVPPTTVDALHSLSPDAGFSRTYPQCGGSLDGEDFPSNHTVLVTEFQDGNGNITGYEARNEGAIAGQCGNYAWYDPRKDTNYVPQGKVASVGDVEGNVYYPSRQYPQCGGELGGAVWPRNNVLLVDELRTESGDKVTYAIQDLGPISGQCGNP